MPLHRGTSRAVVSENIREMADAGHPLRQAVAAALHEKRLSAHTGDRTMDGTRQHKNLAMGKAIDGEGSNFGVPSFGQVNGGMTHPDAAHPTQMMPHGANSKMLKDGHRAGPPHVSRGDGKMPATAHSDHGPHHLPSEGGFGVPSMKSVNG